MRDGEVSLRRLRDEEVDWLEQMLTEPAVARWWPVPDPNLACGWLIEIDGHAGGWLEYDEQPYEWYPSVAFDMALTSAAHGQGYGRRALRLAVDHFAAQGHHRFTVDPNAENLPAIRCYEAVGFRRVGILQAYERSRTGGWSDGLLMELVRLG